MLSPSRGETLRRLLGEFKNIFQGGVCSTSPDHRPIYAKWHMPQVRMGAQRLPNLIDASVCSLVHSPSQFDGEHLETYHVVKSATSHGGRCEVNPKKFFRRCSLEVPSLSPAAWVLGRCDPSPVTAGVCNRHHHSIRFDARDPVGPVALDCERRIVKGASS
jgi:hypothetical protein